MVDLIKSFDDIDKARMIYAKEVLKHLEEVKDKWKVVPELCKAADGVTGYSDQLGMCHQNGIWRIEKSFDGFYVLAIVCETGELKEAGYGALEELKIEDDYITIAKIDPCHFDVDKIIKRLKDKAC